MGDMKTRIALLEKFDEPLALREYPIAPLEAGQVLVAVDAAGVCGSDVHMWRGKDPRTPLPIILGHEGVGTVVEAAGEVKDVHGSPLEPGQRIVWNRGVSCGECHACVVLKEPSLCPNRWAYGIYRPLDVPPGLYGAYAEHIILQPKTDIFALPDDLDPAILVAACCSGATAAHAFDLAPAHYGETVVVYGPGSLGAFAAAYASLAGALHVIVIGGTPERLEICRDLGATHTINRHDTTPEERVAFIKDLTHGRGADLVVETSGSRAAMLEALEAARIGGAVTLPGFGTPVGEVTFPPFERVTRKNLHVQGVWVSDAEHLMQAVAVVRRMPDAFAKLVTHRFPLGRATEALKAVESREALKAVLLPQQS
jgi:threonine dehydrogenase-like Zn-dependent dehydrogenase